MTRATRASRRRRGCRKPRAWTSSGRRRRTTATATRCARRFPENTPTWNRSRSTRSFERSGRRSPRRRRSRTSWRRGASATRLKRDASSSSTETTSPGRRTGRGGRRPFSICGAAPRSRARRCPRAPRRRRSASASRRCTPRWIRKNGSPTTRSSRGRRRRTSWPRRPGRRSGASSSATRATCPRRTRPPSRRRSVYGNRAPRRPRRSRRRRRSRRSR
mmetsp:Transcript_32756/g.101415  ORF Transcript_32756/g.101415 Transcript_32756/m.101415 type:complete len:218 (-) Transcript_32756:888-1541(-)